MSRYILSLDQGTTSSRAIVFDRDGRMVGVAQQEFPQIYPQPGWVEHNPEAIWQTQLSVAQEAMRKANVAAKDIAAIGVTNQRETTVVWDRQTSKPISNAIVWQCRRTAEMCSNLRSAGHEAFFRAKTGLVLDAYFSGTKIAWVLELVPDARRRAVRGELAFGTIDTFLIWRLTGGKVHATDPSNASRTLVFNIQAGDWDDELLAILNIPRALLPEVRPSSGDFGVSDPALFGAPIPICGAAGDQQAATFGQACFEEGLAKNTYGTGCFMLMNTGHKPIPSQNGLLTTVGWTLKIPTPNIQPSNHPTTQPSNDPTIQPPNHPTTAPPNPQSRPPTRPLAARLRPAWPATHFAGRARCCSRPTRDRRVGGVAGQARFGGIPPNHPSTSLRTGLTTYCLEGSVFVAGAAVQWLRDELKIITRADESAELAASVPDTGGVYFVPAFVGLGAPYWDQQARGAIVGLTRGSNRAHIARAALEAIAYQSRDVLDAMESDAGERLKTLRVDGGASANDWLMQFQADILGVPVERPVVTETTALGAAYLAGLAVNYWSGLDELRSQWKAERVFEPRMKTSEREKLLSGWQKAVERVRR